MTELAILYEHPTWFEPLFAALRARGVHYQAIRLEGHLSDPAGAAPPAPVVLNRVAMSSVLRAPEHGIFHAQALLESWEARGARILNGAAALSLDASKARQLSLLASLGLAIPRTRVVHRACDLAAAAAEIGFPLLVKANVGGAGAGIVSYSNPRELAAAVADGTTPRSVDGVLLVQDYVPARGSKIMRIETLAGRFLYALEVESGGDSFDLCPADACLAEPGKSAVAMTAVDPAPALKAAAERIVRAAGIDVGGVELLTDDRDGTPLFYDINALSNFVAKPLEVLGWDPHERLVDYLEDAIGQRKAA
jgi:hypothetical protein